MFVSFFINGFPALPKKADVVEIPNERLPELPKIDDIISPFLQNGSYKVVDVKGWMRSINLILHEVYYIYLTPEDDDAKQSFELQFKRKA